MKFIEQSHELAIQIQGFEEIVALNAVVTAALGDKAETHHLLLPDDHEYGTSLWDAIKLSTEPNARPVTYSGEAKDIIVGALGVAADKTSGSPHQAIAASMMKANGPEYRAELIEALPVSTPQVAVGSRREEFDILPEFAILTDNVTVPRVRSHTDIARRIPARSRAFTLTRRQVALCGFGDMMAARKAVAEFVGEDSVLLEKGREDKAGHPSLMDAIEHTDPNKSEIWTFDGKDARTLRKALKKAAARDETIYDAAAAHILDNTDIVIPEATPAKARRAPAERTRSYGALVLQR